MPSNVGSTCAFFACFPPCLVLRAAADRTSEMLPLLLPFSLRLPMPPSKGGLVNTAAAAAAAARAAVLFGTGGSQVHSCHSSQRNTDSLQNNTSRRLRLEPYTSQGATHNRDQCRWRQGGKLARAHAVPRFEGK